MDNWMDRPMTCRVRWRVAPCEQQGTTKNGPHTHSLSLSLLLPSPEKLHCVHQMWNLLAQKRGFDADKRPCLCVCMRAWALQRSVEKNFSLTSNVLLWVRKKRSHQRFSKGSPLICNCIHVFVWRQMSLLRAQYICVVSCEVNQEIHVKTHQVLWRPGNSYLNGSC